ncbi:M23 family metallopeptidase [Lipingzhangella sp. LS1_29]|uniref:M23 family metallopeptidase n=1 Tax=Lipingzhangella rawalii TaxID=2055835 RepID=A0ABU2H922_9ACTN|nr:M23 family metallopeptidase [Lipingzhangella rawalii]MDS1271099.1 M23 family metallopeptidase [Lipingzhangella rawalii]
MMNRNRVAVFLARIRIPLVLVGAVLILPGEWLGVPFWLGVSVFVMALAVYLRLGRVRRAERTVVPPVSGRWMALNTPADGVPSHGLHTYGQTYAIDLVAEPADASRPDVGWRPLSRPPQDFPAFGEPVLAPGPGRVLRVRDTQRDHRSRTSWPLVFGMIVEGAVRELGGPGRILGNHVVLALDSGDYAVLAHLKQGSTLVAVGDTVVAGQPLAACGNSGNSSEPHVHFQLMDHPRVWLAAGLPFRWERYVDAASGREYSGVPTSWRPVWL